MANYLTGCTTITRGGVTTTSILDIDLGNGLYIFVYPGNLSANDILVKYKQSDTKQRTPKHIHWVVDFMIKQQHEKVLTDQLLYVFSNRWQSIVPLTGRSNDDILTSLILSHNTQLKRRYDTLNNYGYYSVDFLIHLMELLMIQEKTNNPDAYMFSRCLNSLMNSNDLFSIISTATHR